MPFARRREERGRIARLLHSGRLQQLLVLCDLGPPGKRIAEAEGEEKEAGEHETVPCEGHHVQAGGGGHGGIIRGTPHPVKTGRVVVWREDLDLMREDARIPRRS